MSDDGNNAVFRASFVDLFWHCFDVAKLVRVASGCMPFSYQNIKRAALLEVKREI